MSKQESKRHHYIPQFILKNFYNENQQINYWDISKAKLEARNTKSIFMGKNMYRDEKFNSNDPTKIETQFAVFESEISELIAQKIIDKKEIVLTRAELEKLRIFTFLLSFRSNHRKTQYDKSNFDLLTKTILEQSCQSNDFSDLWKQELDILTTCRSYEDIENSKKIDPIIHQEILNDLIGYYMTFVDAMGEHFLLSDIYPTAEIYPVANNININMHFIFPISPKRALILNHIAFKETNGTNQISTAMLSLSKIQGNAIKQPKPLYKYSPRICDKEDKFTYKVTKIYNQDIEYINALILNEAQIGIIFQDKKNIISSIEAFNFRQNTKQNFSKLEEILNNKK